MRKIFLVFTGLVFLQVAYMQTSSFSKDPVKFYDELEKFMKQSENKEMKDFMEEFELVWNDGPFAIYRDQVIDFSNALLAKRYRAELHFKAYLRAVMDYHKNAHPKTNFDAWQKGLDWMIKKKSGTYLVDYIELSTGLFNHNYLIKLPGHTWFTESPTWKIEFTEGDVIRWVYPEANIKCIGKDDSTMIENTSGVYLPLEERFEGKKGTVYWTRNGLQQDAVFAVLNNYSINIKRSTFTADSVMFTNKQYFPSPLQGRLEEKLTDIVEGRDYNYPKFDSYSKKFSIKNIFYNTDYEGGFSFYGKRFVAKGDSSDLATIRIYNEGNLFIKATSKSFSIEEEKFTSQRAAVYIYLGEDSIYHPGLDFKILKKDSTVSMLRFGEGTVQTPFQDSYHDIEMYFELMQWGMKTKFMTISSSIGADQNEARFRSQHFYNDVEYTRMQGMDDIHPLVKLNKFIREKNGGDSTFTALAFAQYLKFDLSQTRQMLMRFSIAGLISYNIDREIGTINPRFYHVINSAARTTDYDVIEIFSMMGRNKDNAKLSLLDYRLDIAGVNNVIISDSQDVEIFPYAKQVTLKKDMDFGFNGRLFAGRFAMYGKNFNFSYKNFMFKMADIDSIKIIARSLKKDFTGEYPDTILNSKIEDLEGELFVDHPNNKSGLKPFPEYPSFVSSKKSYVYYEYPGVEKGVYKRNEFYFMLDPFKKDTLDEFHTTSINFDGTFVSDGIFPDLREKLIIMPDYSLGFFKRTDSKGLKAYGGKATYRDTLTLSNRGLRGGGTLDYLTSTATSRDFVFYPDSMNAFAQKFGIKKQKGGIETPDVKAKDVYIHWEPQKDEFAVTETGSKFEMYEGESTMNGTLTLTPDGLEGDGNFHFGINADMVSNQFKFKSDNFKTDTTKFSLTDIPTEAGDTAQVAFKTDNVRADVTFVDRKASLKSNSPDSYVEFPQNKFIAYMEEMEYYMDKNEVELNSRKVNEIGLRGALFVSTDPRLDSLSFAALKADFLVPDKVINCSGVKYIDVADSRIFPVDEKVIIRKGADIDQFVDAKIWVGKTDKIHVLEHATLKISSSHKYSGTADYTYVDEIGKAQVIKMHSVEVDEKDITVAEGRVEQIADFSMSPTFGFKGTVHLYGKNQFLTFDGYTKIVHLCKNMNNQWMKFQAEIDPNNIYIPISKEPENDEQNKLFNGFLFASDSTGLYPSIVAAKKRYSDVEVLGVSGYLFFDKKTQEFKISSKEKLQDAELPGNYIAFNANTCASHGEGQMDLGSKLGQVDLKCSGSIQHEPQADDISMSILLTMNFKLEQSLTKYMEDKIKSVTTTGADINDDLIKRNITDLLDSGKADKIYSNVADGKFKRLPSDLKKMLVLTGLELKWDKNQRSLLHSGNVGIMVFNGEQVNKSADAFVELNRKASGDIITIYLEFDETNWFYFQYRNNVMNICSGNKDFMDLLAALDANKRQFQDSGGLPTYTITPAPVSRVNKFKEKFGVTNDK